MGIPLRGRLLSGWRNSEARVYAIRDELAGTEVLRFKPPDAEAWSVGFSPDGSRATLVSQTGLAAYDLTGREPPRVVRVAEDRLNTVGLAAGPVLAWGHGSVQHRQDGPLSTALVS